MEEEGLRRVRKRTNGNRRGRGRQPGGGRRTGSEGKLVGGLDKLAGFQSWLAALASKQG